MVVVAVDVIVVCDVADGESGTATTAAMRDGRRTATGADEMRGAGGAAESTTVEGDGMGTEVGEASIIAGRGGKEGALSCAVGVAKSIVVPAIFHK